MVIIVIIAVIDGEIAAVTLTNMHGARPFTP